MIKTAGTWLDETYRMKHIEQDVRNDTSRTRKIQNDMYRMRRTELAIQQVTQDGTY